MPTVPVLDFLMWHGRPARDRCRWRAHGALTLQRMYRYQLRTVGAPSDSEPHRPTGEAPVLPEISLRLVSEMKKRFGLGRLRLQQLAQVVVGVARGARDMLGVGIGHPEIQRVGLK